MKTRVLLFLLFVIVLSSAGTLVTVLFNTAPNTREVIGLFYLALIGTLFGLVFFPMYGFWALRFQGLPDWQTTLQALRVALIIGVLGAVALAIRSVELLNVATVIILVVLAIFVELMSRRKIALFKK